MAPQRARALQTLGPEFDPRVQVKILGIVEHTSNPRVGSRDRSPPVLGGQIALPKW